MRFPALLLSLALSIPAVYANELLNAYQLAVESDPTLQAASFGRDAAREAYPQARAAYLPQINGGYSYGYEDQETTTMMPLPTTSSSGSISKGLSVTANQALLNWEAIQRLRQASEQVAVAETSYRASEQDLVLRVAQAYFDVLAANDNLRFTEAENNAVGRQLDQAKKRFEVGLTAITDVQETQARYDLTVASKIAAEQALSSAKEALATITGQPVNKVAALQDNIPLPAPDPADVNAWLKAAGENNLSLLIARLNATVADRGVSVAQSRHLPTVGLQAGYSDGESGGRFAAEQTSGSVSVQVNVPLFSGFATQSGVRAAVATHEQTKSQEEATRRLVEKSTRDAYQAVLSGAAQVKAFQQAVLSSTTALQASETGLEVGARTSIDVLNAQQQLYSAQRTYSQSRYNYLLSILRLKSAAGQLGVNDLAEIDRLLIAS